MNGGMEEWSAPHENASVRTDNGRRGKGKGDVGCGRDGLDFSGETGWGEKIIRKEKLHEWCRGHFETMVPILDHA